MVSLQWLCLTKSKRSNHLAVKKKLFYFGSRCPYFNCIDSMYRVVGTGWIVCRTGKNPGLTAWGKYIVLLGMFCGLVFK